jgi:hypothetical protein
MREVNFLYIDDYALQVQVAVEQHEVGIRTFDQAPAVG